MIEIFEGRIGGGKTYTAVERVAECIAAGGTCYLNIDTNFEGMKKLVERRFGTWIEEDQIRPLPEDVYGWHKKNSMGHPGQSCFSNHR